MSQKLQKKSKKIVYLMASLMLAAISFGGSFFTSNTRSTVYADAIPFPDASPVPDPCPDPCPAISVGDNDKLA